MKAYFFGCWNTAGHYLFHSGGATAYEAEDRVVYFALAPDGRMHIDGALAPRTWRPRWGTGLCWAAQGKTKDERDRIQYHSDEQEQGYYLIHHINGLTYMSWWDRNQGDKRGACNSNFILEGTHDAVKMFDELVVSFPHVVENLRKADIPLKQVVLF